MRPAIYVPRKGAPLGVGPITNTARIASTIADLNPESNTVITVVRVIAPHRIYMPLILRDTGP